MGPVGIGELPERRTLSPTENPLMGLVSALVVDELGRWLSSASGIDGAWPCSLVASRASGKGSTGPGADPAISGSVTGSTTDGGSSWAFSGPG